MGINPKFDELLGAIDTAHAAAIDPEAWRSLGSRLERLFRGPAALISHSDRPATVIAATIVDDSHSHAYLSHFWKLDRGMLAVATGGEAKVLRDSAWLERRDPVRAEFYSDYLSRFGVNFGLYGTTARVCSTFTVLAVHRREDFDDTDSVAVQRLLPHLARSLRLGEELAGLKLQNAALFDALEHAKTAALIVDQNRRVLNANAQAERILQQGPLQILNGRLQARGAWLDSRLAGAIARAAAVDGCAAEIDVPDAFGGVRHIAIHPARPEHMLVPRRLALVLLGRRRGRSIAALAEHFGLTATEAELFGWIASGRRLADYARTHGVTLSTAKTHLASIFQKTGRHRQAELVLLGAGDEPPMTSASCADPPSGTNPMTSGCR